jgi:aspartyl-tRNA(Asn)/glutamyl-tRNA(Gln) amidotransferase subunit C
MLCFFLYIYWQHYFTIRLFTCQCTGRSKIVSVNKHRKLRTCFAIIFNNKSILWYNFLVILKYKDGGIMKVTAREVQYIARLARLEIGEGELELFVRQFNDILGYVDVLSKIDTENVEPTAQVLAYGNVMREDIVKPSLPQEEILANAPEKKNGGYLVPRVMEGGGA